MAGHRQGGSIRHRRATQAGVADPERSRSVMALFERFDDLDDVQSVYSSVDFDDTMLETMESVS